MKYLSLNGLKLFYKSLLEKIDKKIKNQIDEIEIGGRNLLTGTASFNISYKSRGNMSSHIVSENYQGLTVRYYNKAWNFYRPVISLKAGVYTFSGYAKRR